MAGDKIFFLLRIYIMSVVPNIDDNIEPKNIKNSVIVREFRRLIKQIKYHLDHSATRNESMGNYYRLKQLTNSLDIVLKYPREIKNGNQLKDIKGVGKGTISRIDEILKTGKLSEIKLKEEDEKYFKFIDELEQVIGIGRKTAFELIKKYKITSIEELKKAADKGVINLTNQIKIGLKYHDVYKQLIPRSEIDKINILIRDTVETIDPDLMHVICGSYRRLKEVSNDVDILIVHPKIRTMKQLTDHDSYLRILIKRLKDINFLVDDLTYNEYDSKYMGFCQLTMNEKQYPVRRIDMRYVPFESFYTALLYFTGSGTFNKKMRLIAIELGYKLSEYGLYKKDNKRLLKIKVESEQEIFEKLGMEYLPPEMR